MPAAAQTPPSNLLSWGRRALLAGLALLPVSQALAQEAAARYPSRPVRLVVPFPPGGPTDIAARALAQKLSERLGQAVLIDNKPGAGGSLGAAEASRAQADGYTLLYGSTSTLAVNPALSRKLGYHPVKDFTPVSLVAYGPQILVVSSALPVSNAKEFVDYVKKNSAQVNYSSPGEGSLGHLTAELLLDTLGIKATHVPYKGGAPAISAAASGETQFTVDAVGTTAAFVKSGRLKALAVLSEARSSFAPELPTFSEAGLPNVTGDFWSGIVAPAGTPQPIIDKLSLEVREALKQADLIANLKKLGAEPQGSTSAEFANRIQADGRKWSGVVVKAGIKVE